MSVQGGDLAQNGKPCEIGLHGGVVTCAAGIPAACGFYQRGTHLNRFGLLGGEVLAVRRGKTARRGAHVPAQSQPAQRARGHRFGTGSALLCHALADVAANALVIEGVRAALGARRPDPLLAPGLYLFPGAAQLRVGQRDRDARQIEGFAQRRVAVLFIEQLFDVREVPCEHPRTGGRNVLILHEANSPSLQAAWSAGVTAKGAPSSAGAAAGAGGALVVEAARRARRGARRVRRRVVALPAVRFGAARCAAAGRLAAAELRFARAAAFFTTLDPGLSFWARRARFQTLRAAMDCLRARLASRLASFRRLRARFSSSLAMRTRCLATSACSRARSRGSAGVSCSLPVFFIGGLATGKTRSLTQAGGACHRAGLIHRICA